LRLPLEVALSSSFPMALRWGPEVWREIEPIYRKILHGKAARSLPRTSCCGSREIRNQWDDARFTLSYSPTPDPTAPIGIGGAFATTVETTARVETERQLRRSNFGPVGHFDRGCRAAGALRIDRQARQPPFTR